MKLQTMESKPAFLLLCLMAPLAALADPVFVDRSADLGIAHQYTGGWEHFVGGGVASFDCDGDLFPELFVAGGDSTASLFRNRTGQRGGEVIFRNETPESLRLTGVTGAYPIDIDSDGYLDLMILRAGPNRILRGGPDCGFEAFPPSFGFDSGERWSTAFSATWESGESLPTLAVGNYVDRTDPDGPFGTCDANMLYRPEGGKYVPPAKLTPGFCALSLLFSDWGRNGRQDLRISNDRHYYGSAGMEQMWAMTETPRLYGAEDGWTKFQFEGMGIASRDISGDGVPEIFLSSMGDQRLQFLDTSAQGPRFVDAAYERGTTAHRPYFGDNSLPSTGWQVEFGDVQNDGLDDIFIAKGNVEDMAMAALEDPNNLLIQMQNGRFVEMGAVAGVGNTDRSRGAALIDFNLDGRLDLVVVNRRAPVEIYQNATPDTGNWLLLDIMQPGVNPDAIGGWIEVEAGNRRWSREITIGGGHAGGAQSLMHFGLGGAQRVRLRVQWPDGSVTGWQDIGVNKILRLTRQSNTFVIEPL